MAGNEDCFKPAYQDRYGSFAPCIRECFPDIQEGRLSFSNASLLLRAFYESMKNSSPKVPELCLCKNPEGDNILSGFFVNEPHNICRIFVTNYALFLFAGYKTQCLFLPFTISDRYENPVFVGTPIGFMETCARREIAGVQNNSGQNKNIISYTRLLAGQFKP